MFKHYPWCALLCNTFVSYDTYRFVTAIVQRTCSQAIMGRGAQENVDVSAKVFHGWPFD